ncbi:hypothetical protein BMF94_0428 [Rhodotorula taiwanensis]|uniref:UDENN domain-containing protein n=1 Tax=Rhodotorula taiwanensis TaxID=741276 RepID=A0A2S5BHK8_9BASI|nr:hypothetical protein BMF94_0428 [Rhodotorula taiwanensis]
MAEPVDGDLGLRLYDPPSPRAQSAAVRSELAAAPLCREPTSTAAARAQHLVKPTHARTETLTRRISFPHLDLARDTLLNLRRTVLTFAVVEFDIDSGPNLDNTYPATRFPPAVNTNIAFSSLPEGADLPPPPTTSVSAAGDEQGYAYSWKIPYPPPDELVRIDNAADLGPDKHVFRLPATSEESREQGTGALYGYVWFVREQDSRLRRGYAQRSLVLISHLPDLSGLFSSLMAILGPLHFKHAQNSGTKGGMVETACHNLASWPDLVPGSTLELPFLGSVLTVSVPLPHQPQFPSSFTSGTLSFTSLPYTHPPSPFLSHQAWSASNRPGADPPSRKRRIAAASSSSASADDGLAAAGGGGLPASLPLTPLCTLLFAPPPPGPNGLSRSSHLTAPGAVGRPDLSPSFLRKSPSLGHASSSSSSAAAAASSSSTSSSPLGSVDFSTLVVLWELMVLGEPVLVWSGDPKTGSEVVEWLKALIRPIPFAGDDRPYLHVHDADFATLCRPGEKPPPGLLIASTNPLLLTTCKHWPHILRLDRPASASALAGSPSQSPRFQHPQQPPNRSPSLSIPLSGSGPGPGSAGSSRHASPSPTGFRTPQRSSSTGSRFGAGERTAGPVGAGGAVVNKEFGLKSTRKRHVKKDDVVKKEIEALWLAGDYAGCDSAIYRYFASLTEQFLAPLNRYFGTLWVGNEIVARNTPLLSPGPHPAPSTRFSSSSFLASLRAHGSSLSFRSSAPSLSQPGTSSLDRFYLRFIDESPHFQAWLDERIRVMGGEVRRRYVRELEKVDIERWAREKQLREMDDMVGTFEREVGRLEPVLLDLQQPPTTRTPSRPGQDSPIVTAAIPTHDPEVPTAGPAAKLRAQASRLRSIRDEKVRSLSRDRSEE